MIAAATRDLRLETFCDQFAAVCNFLGVIAFLRVRCVQHTGIDDLHEVVKFCVMKEFVGSVDNKCYPFSRELAALFCSSAVALIGI